MNWLRVVLLLLCTQSIADSSSISFALPSPGINIGGSTNFELGLTGIISNAVTPLIGKKSELNPQTKDIGVYARIIIPLDGPNERINCNTLYQLELQRRRLEVQKLKQEIEYLKQMQNNNEFDN